MVKYALADSIKERGRYNTVTGLLYEYMPKAVERILKRCYPYLLPFSNVRVPVTRICGPVRHGNGTGVMIVAGDRKGCDYAIERFFQQISEETSIGTGFLGNLDKTLKDLESSADLILLRIDALSARLLFNNDWLALPEWSGTSLILADEFSTFREPR